VGHNKLYNQVSCQFSTVHSLFYPVQKFWYDHVIFRCFQRGCSTENRVQTNINTSARQACCMMLHPGGHGLLKVGETIFSLDVLFISSVDDGIGVMSMNFTVHPTKSPDATAPKSSTSCPEPVSLGALTVASTQAP